VAALLVGSVGLATGSSRSAGIPPSSAAADRRSPVAPVFRLGDAARPFGWSTAIADFNTDGEPDVAVADRMGGTAGGYSYRIRFSISGQESNEVLFESTHDAVTITVFDVDRDNDLDVIVDSVVDGEPLVVWLNDGHGRFTSADVRLAPSTIQSGQTLGSQDCAPTDSGAGQTNRRFEQGLQPAPGVLMPASARGGSPTARGDGIQAASETSPAGPRAPPPSSLKS